MARTCALALTQALAGAAVLCPSGLAWAQASSATLASSRIDDPAGLSSFFGALDDLKAGRRTRPVHVLQIGDSHSAADHISGALRARLQARFGEGGRGVLPAGRPFAAYNPRQVSVEQSDGWRLEASYLPTNWTTHAALSQPGAAQPASGAFGLSGFRLVALRAGASVTIRADPEAQFDEAVVCAVAGAGAASLGLDIDADRHEIHVASPGQGPNCRTIETAGLHRTLRLTAHGPLTLLSLGAFRRGGVALSNLGVIGAQLRNFAERDDATMAAELKAYHPDLILLAFGTNEGFERSLSGAEYENLMRAQIQRLKRLAPGAAVLVVGPPDADTVRPDIPEDGKADLGFACLPLSPAELAEYPRLIAERSAALARWYPPPVLQIVRSAQRQAAAEEHVGFWDWAGRLGGPCSAHAFTKADPRLVRGDHVHFTTAGGEMVADLLTGDLISAWAAAAGHR